MATSRKTPKKKRGTLRGFPPTVEVRMVKINAAVLDERQAAEYTGAKLSFLRDARTGRTTTPGPRETRIGRSVFYTLPALDEWLAEKEEKQTA